jgi:hypothetical protein
MLKTYEIVIPIKLRFDTAQPWEPQNGVEIEVEHIKVEVGAIGRVQLYRGHQAMGTWSKGRT